ncbi:THO complex subunit 4D-like [Salvia splendens]|uniref:THO complex subunit 4D-like n=1 Tax=Salvia splendens TaxID=180675 RepID=UPI001C276C62|nr:THO complex subunit 4D-like [Salvia splendens]
MASLDMSLDDMIKSRKSTVKGGRGQGRPRRGRGGPGGPSRGGRTPFGAPRRNPLGLNARPSAHSIAKSFRRTKNLPWHSGLVEESLKSVGLSGLEAGTKLFISNLDVGVSNEDIRELFSEIGELIRYAIHFDKNGRPSGSAEVVFARLSDAFQALKRYNNVQLDGKPMKIEIVGANAGIPMSARVNVVGGANGKKRTVVMASGPARSRGGFTPANRGTGQRGRGGLNTGRGGGGRGGGRGRGGAQWRKKVEKSADDLDKELDSYHAEAMQS